MPSCCPEALPRCSACSRSARARASPWCRSAAERASSAGSSRCAGGFERLLSLDLRRLRDVARRSTLADGDAGSRAARSGGRGGPERAGDDARPFPPVVRVRDDRRLRRDSLRRAGVERLWAVRRAGHGDRPHRAGRRSSNARDPPQRRRPGAARAGRRLRGNAGGDRAGRPRGFVPFRSAGATRRGWRPTSPPAPRWCARSPRPTCSRTWCGSPTKRRRESRWRSRGRPEPSAPCSRPTCGCAGGPAGCLIVCGWEGEPADGRAAPSAVGEGASLGWRRGPRRRAGPGLGAGAVRGPLPARRAARPRLSGRDAGDRPHLEPPRASLRGGPGGDRRRARQPGHPRDRHLPSLPRLPGRGLALLHLPGARRRPGAEIEQWRVVKTAACEAIVEAGGTITHHHAVGRDHAPYMRAEVGELGIDVLRAVKERLDPGRDHEPRQADSGDLAPGVGRRGGYRQGFQGLASSEKSPAFLIELVPRAAALSQNRLRRNPVFDLEHGLARRA